MTQPLIQITKRQSLIFAFFLLLYEFLTYIANDMIMPGMIKVVESFHGAESNIANSLTAYLLGGSSLQLILGPLSDRFGRRPVMLFGTALFFLCTIGIASSNSMEQFMLGRFFQGMGLCFIGVVGYAALQEIFAEMDAIRLTSLMASVALVAPLIGPLLGAVFIHYYPWRWIFIVIASLTLFTFWGLWRYMPETIGALRRDGETLTRMTLTPKVIFLNYKTLLHNASYMNGTLALGLQVLPCIVWIALAPIIFVTKAHLSFIAYGLWQIPVFSACIFGNLVLHRMTYRRSITKLVNIGAIIIIAGLLSMFILPLLFGDIYFWLIPGILIYFFGLGFAGSPLYRLVLYSTPVMKGTASALMTMIGMLIQAVGLALANLLYTTHNNIILAFYCVVVGLLYIVLLVKIEANKGA
jgi:DHA1 family multidrug/chloramphenicol efflux transport protein-like MFS transporter